MRGHKILMALLFGAVPVAVVCYKAFWAHGQGALGLGLVAVTRGTRGHRVLTPDLRRGVDGRPCGHRGGSLSGCLLGGRLLGGRLLSSRLVKISL